MYFLWDMFMPPHNLPPKNYSKGGLPQKICKKPMFYTEPPPYLPTPGSTGAGTDGPKFQCISYGDIFMPPHNFGPKNYPQGGLPQKVCKNPMFYTEPPPYLPNEKKIFFKFIYFIYPQPLSID